MHILNNSRTNEVIVVTSLLILAFCLRVRNLDGLALFGDEGIQALAVDGIFNYGVPKLDSGIVYARSILFIYTQFFFTFLFELNEFWLRLPGVICGTLVVIPTYVLGKHIFNKTTGIIAALIIVFSVWQIEISRYARFYSIFQLFFMSAILYYYKGFLKDNYKFKLLFLFFALLSMLTHQFGQLLGLLFIIPIVLANKSWSKRRFHIYGIAGFIAAVFLNRFITSFFKKWEGNIQSFSAAVPSTNQNLSGKISNALGLPQLKLPEFRFFLESMDSHLLIPLSLSILTIFVSIYFVNKISNDNKKLPLILLYLANISAIFYQFTLSINLLLFYLLIRKNSNNLFQKDRNLFVATFFLLIYLIFWVMILTTGAKLDLHSIVDLLFGFPNVLGYIFKWLIPGWPVITGLLITGILLIVSNYLTMNKKSRSIYLIAALYLFIIGASLFDSYAETRYFFHLYPIIILISSYTLYTIYNFLFINLNRTVMWSKPALLSLLTLVVILVSKDINPVKAYQLPNHNYSSQKDRYRNPVTWSFYSEYHPDRKSPSLYIKDNMKNEDKVVVLGPVHMIAAYHYYTGKVHYTVAPNFNPDLHDTNPHNYAKVSDNTVLHYVNGSKLLFNLEELQRLRNSEQKIWLLGDYPILNKSNNYYDKKTKSYLRKLAESPDYIGMDGKTFAVKIN